MFVHSKILQSTVLHLAKKAFFSSLPVGIVGVPFAKGQSKHGVCKGPDALRSFGLIRELGALGIDVKDYGNLSFVDTEDTCSEKLKDSLVVGSACKKISDAVVHVLEDKRKCVTLGGDHSIAIGTVDGHSRVHNDLCVLWIDAHADINTPSTTPSGHYHGMSCSFFIQELHKYRTECSGFEWVKPRVKKANMAYIGLRDLDPLEKLILKKEDILHFSMRDVDQLGIIEVFNRAVNHINPSGSLSMHVSFDVDSLDKLIIPSTGTPVHGGLTVREALCLAEEVSKLDSVHAIDIVEVNPMLGCEKQVENTLEITTLIIKTFLGYSREGQLPPNVHEIPT